MVGTNLKAEMMALMDERDAMESEMNLNIHRLCQEGGPDLSANLVDSEVARLNASYPGGLMQYIKNARELLEDSKAGKNSFDGFTPSAPGMRMKIHDPYLGGSDPMADIRGGSDIQIRKVKALITAWLHNKVLIEFCIRITTKLLINRTMQMHNRALTQT